jgi:pyridoxine 5-phosphate synthase
MKRLGVNIDHVATIRQARRTIEPDPVWAAVLAELGGADVITVHLREDRRHISDRDVRVLRETVQVPLNLEMAAADEIVKIAVETRPHQATLVPERRAELTTEGGLDVIGNTASLVSCISQLQSAGIVVSLFIDPDPRQVLACRALGASAVEFHTGSYAEAKTREQQQAELARLEQAAKVASVEGLAVHLGHGLTYRNVVAAARLPHVVELNIGHSIVSRAVLVGMERAVSEMKMLINS